MPIEFAYAGARAQARLGARPSPDTWRLLDSTPELAHYLHSARGTVLSRYLRHFTSSSSPHAIERSLRRDWRAEVDHARRWVPRRWRGCIGWARWLPDLPAIDHLVNDEEVLPWMTDDPVLSAFALRDADTRRQAVLGSEFAELAGAKAFPLEWWRRQWQARWPAAAHEQSKLLELVDLLQTHSTAMEQHDTADVAARDVRIDLEKQVVRLLRNEHQQPVAVFCHLLLTALDFLRLRAGLVRRSLFNDMITRSPS